MNKSIFSLIVILTLIWSNATIAESTLISNKLTLEEQPSAKTYYFTVTPDWRECISPICGGWFIKAVNRKKIKCPDGAKRKECYVGTDEIHIPDLTDEQIAQLRQSMQASRVLIQGQLSNAVDYGLLIINNAWISATEQQPKGVFASVSDNGTRCITHPCLSYDARILNRLLQRTIADIDLSQVNADQEQLELAQAALQTKEGLPVAGRFTEITGPAGSARGIIAKQFYLKVAGEKPITQQCMPTGCSGQVCADSDVLTTCEWKPEYACYKTAQCTIQGNGDCGWTMNDELKECLENARIEGFLQ